MPGERATAVRSPPWTAKVDSAFAVCMSKWGVSWNPGDCVSVLTCLWAVSGAPTEGRVGELAIGWALQIQRLEGSRPGLRHLCILNVARLLIRCAILSLLNQRVQGSARLSSNRKETVSVCK